MKRRCRVQCWRFVTVMSTIDTKAPSFSWVRSEDALHEEASADVGYDDFGDPSYLEGLRVVLAAYDEEARFHEAGREMAKYQLVHSLKQRLTTERAWKHKPKSFDVEIRRHAKRDQLARA